MVKAALSDAAFFMPQTYHFPLITYPFFIVRNTPSVSPQLCTMTDFAALYNCSEPNLVGLPIIEYVSVLGISSFQTFQLADGRLRGTISLKPYFKFLKLPIRLLDPDKQFWDESKNETTQGIAQDVKIQGILPMLSPQIEAELDEMEREKFIVRIEDAAGRKFVLGSTNFPLRFKASWNSSRGFYTVEFAGKQLHKAMGY